jgi:hypothetical protein
MRAARALRIGVALALLACSGAACSSSSSSGSGEDAAPPTAADEDGPYLAFYGAGLETDASPPPADATAHGDASASTATDGGAADGAASD